MKPVITNWINNTIYLEDSKGEFTITFRILKSRRKVDYDFDSWKNYYTVSVKSGRRLRREFIRELIADAYTGTYCQHSYDCCGCSFWRTYYSDVKHFKRNEYRILQHVYINC